MRYLSFFAFCSSLCLYAKAQTITKYYDEEWAQTTKEKAVFYADFVNKGKLYECTSYYMQSGTVRGKSFFSDTVMSNPRGLQVLYRKNGALEDSTLYDSSGKMIYNYHYYPNKRLAVYYHLPDGAKVPVIEGFDEQGNKIKNFIYAKEAEFKGGEKAWVDYLRKNLSTNFTAKGNQEETVQVRISFVVNEEGLIIRPKVLESSGIKEIDADAIRVITSSPKWIPAILYNAPIKVYRIQPLTYMLYPKSKRK